MPGVQFVNQIDMNSNLITELAPGVAGTDAVNVNQMNASMFQGFAQTIGDGVATSFTITHNLNTFDVLEPSVYEVSSGNFIKTFTRVATVNTVEVSFVLPPATNQYRVLVIPVP